MDLFALGTPVIDEFAKADDALLAKLGAKKGATNYYSAEKIAAIERSLGKRIAYRYPGDNARNVCEGVSALGGFAGFQGMVGTDREAVEVEANLSMCGVAAFLQQKKGSTGKIIALITPDSQRTFLADLGVSRGCSEYEKDAVGGCKIFYCASFNLCFDSPVKKLTLRYFEAAKKGKKRIAMSLESPPLVAAHKKTLLCYVKKYADIVFLNEDEAEALLGKKYKSALLKLKPSALVYLKKGKDGSSLLHKGKRLHVPALSAKVVDTTGAGDSYAAGVLYGLSRGYSPLSSAKLGCMLATKVVQTVGAGIPMKHTRLRLRH